MYFANFFISINMITYRLNEWKYMYTMNNKNRHWRLHYRFHSTYVRIDVFFYSFSAYIYALVLHIV